jgi:predicted phage tail protein
MRVFNAVGASSYSNTTSQTTPTVPGAPSSVSGTKLTNTSFRINWGAASSTGGSPITGYQVERQKIGGTSWTAVGTFSASTFQATVSGITGGTHQARVRAVNAVGVSAWTTSATFNV